MRDTPDANVLLDLIQRQSSASSTLTDCTTFREMAGAIAHNMVLEAGQFITISLLEYGDDGVLIRLTTIATANRQATYDAYEAVEVKQQDLGDSLSTVLDNSTPVILEAVAEHQDVPPSLQEWLKNNKIRAVAIWPMRHENQTFGVVCLNSISDHLDLSPTTVQIYQVLADQVGALIQVNNLTSESSYSHEISERQRRVFDELNPAMTYEQMASAVARHMLTARKRFISLIQFFHDEKGQVSGWRTLATANRDRAYSWDDLNVTFDWETLNPQLRNAIAEGKPFVVEDMDTLTEDFAGKQFKDFFEFSQIKSQVTIPVLLMEDRALIGLGIMSQTKTIFSQEEINALSNVAEQVSALIQAHSLLQEAQSAQGLAGQLAQTNREIAAAESYEVLAKTLMQVMPEAVKVLAVALFDKSIQPGERPTALESKVIISRNGTSHLQVVDQFPPHSDLLSTLSRLNTGEIISLPKTAGSVLPPITVSLLQAQDVSSVSLIALRIGSRLLGLLILGSESPLNLGRFEADNFRALADQVAISIENRDLLDQTADTLSFVQSQFEATSTVYDAKYPLETLQAVYRFLGGQFKHAHLGLIDVKNAPSTVRIAAEIHHGQTSTDVHEVALDSYPASEALPALETLYVPEVANEAFLNDAERARLQSQDIAGLVIVPMVVNQRMIGLITFMNPTPTTLSPNRLRALRNLADQAAVVFENQALLASTAATLDETRLLYDVNRTILAAQDTLDVLRAVREHLAPEASNINHMNLSYDSQGQILEARVDFINLLGGDEQAVDMLLSPVIGSQKIVALQSLWEHNPNAVSFVEDMDAVLTDNPLADYFIKNGTHSSISILIRDSNQVREAVTIAFTYPQKFETHQKRLYEAISDQIAIVLQNHRLLLEAQVNAAQLARQVQTLQTINQFATVINAVSNESALLDTSAEMAVELLGIDHCGIVLAEPGEDYGIVVSEHPKHGSIGAKVAIVNNPLWGELQGRLGDFRPLIIPNVNVDSRIEPLTRKAFSDLGIYSMAILPIVIHNELVGGLGLDIYTKGRSVTPDMVEIAQIITAQINLALENVRLLKDIQSGAERLKDQVQVLQTLNQLASRTNATLDQQELLDNTTQSVPNLLNVNHCGVVLLDGDKTIGRVVSEYPVTGANGREIEMLEGNPLYAFIRTRDMRPVIVDVESDTRLDDNNRGLLRSVGTKTLAIVPLIVSGDVIGTLGLDIYEEGRSFTPAMVEIAQTVASQLAIGLQNIRLLTDTSHRAEQLQRVASFSQSVQATFDPAAIFDAVLNESAQMLSIDQMSIMLYDTVKQELRTVAQRIDTTNDVQLTDGEIVPISGPIAQVWSTREPMNIPDLRKTSHDINPSVTVRSWMMTPILARGRVIGLVSAGSHHPSAFADTDVVLFTQMINQLAVAIENADAYQQSQRIAKNESLVNDISTQLQRQMDIRSMLDITATELGKVLGARRASIRLATHVPDNNEAE